jgi:hypothetical protein
MEVIHHIGVNTLHIKNLPGKLSEMGVDYKEQSLPGIRTNALITFDISESHESWLSVHKLISSAGAFDMYDTFFEEEEIASAKWVRLISAFEHGYPQPEETWVTDPINYSEKCNSCGTYKQVAPFQIRSEPKLGKKDFMSLYWGWNIFASIVAIKEFDRHELEGFEAWDVLIYKKDKISEKIKQLVPLLTAEPALIEKSELEFEICDECGKKKYFYHNRGIMYLSEGAIPQGTDLCYTHEWFGAGGKSAYKEILASKKFVEVLLKNKWTGLRMKRVELI